MPSLDVQKFLEDVSGKYARAYTEAVHRLTVAIAMQNKPAARDARERLGRVIAETMGIGEVLGASIVLKRTAGLLREMGGQFERDSRYLMHFSEQPTQNLIPRVTLSEALQDMVDRTPVTIRNAAERTAQRISQLYSEGSVVAFVNSAEQAVTERVKSLFQEAIRTGIGEGEAGKRIPWTVNEVSTKTRIWSEGYSRMAFRTNLNTATTAGRFRQVQDPDVKKVIPAFRYDSVGDSDTRENHDAADGIVMSVDSTEWRKIAPPLGYNCRCDLTLMSRPELRRQGYINPDGSIKNDKVPAGAHPDVGFRHGGRPDLLMVAEAG